jgi:hypothetical protein
MNEFGKEWIIHLGPQAPDVDVDEIGVALKIDLPDLIGDIGARENFASFAHQ